MAARNRKVAAREQELKEIRSVQEAAQRKKDERAAQRREKAERARIEQLRSADITRAVENALGDLQERKSYARQRLDESRGRKLFDREASIWLGTSAAFGASGALGIWYFSIHHVSRLDALWISLILMACLALAAMAIFSWLEFGVGHWLQRGSDAQAAEKDLARIESQIAAIAEQRFRVVKNKDRYGTHHGTRYVLDFSGY
jgi:cation transport ATPase